MTLAFARRRLKPSLDVRPCERTGAFRLVGLGRRMVLLHCTPGSQVFPTDYETYRTVPHSEASVFLFRGESEESRRRAEVRKTKHAPRLNSSVTITLGKQSWLETHRLACYVIFDDHT